MHPYSMVADPATKQTLVPGPAVLVHSVPRGEVMVESTITMAATIVRLESGRRSFGMDLAGIAVAAPLLFKD